LWLDKSTSLTGMQAEEVCIASEQIEGEDKKRELLNDIDQKAIRFKEIKVSIVVPHDEENQVNSGE
jgi:hypothetical protein